LEKGDRHEQIGYDAEKNSWLVKHYRESDNGFISLEFRITRHGLRKLAEILMDKPDYMIQ
jgi:hypothetical protein